MIHDDGVNFFLPYDNDDDHEAIPHRAKLKIPNPKFKIKQAKSPKKEE